MAASCLSTEVANMSLLGRAVAVCVASLLVGHTAVGGEPIDLSPQLGPNSLTHVTIQLDAGGQNLVRADGKSNGKESDDNAKADEKKLPISVAAKLAYDELRLANPAV